ncbi:hypothetical protein AAVH_13062 [Aphelenchoides avenae]|nr:hypothetical protein AAVH_13062 [Aphelenchus avenae]
MTVIPLNGPRVRPQQEDQPQSMLRPGPSLAERLGKTPVGPEEEERLIDNARQRRNRPGSAALQSDHSDPPIAEFSSTRERVRFGPGPARRRELHPNALLVQVDSDRACRVAELQQSAAQQPRDAGQVGAMEIEQEDWDDEPPSGPSPRRNTIASATSAARQQRNGALPRAAAQHPRNVSWAVRANMNVKLVGRNEAPLNTSPQPETSAAAAAIQPRYGGGDDTAASEDEEHWSWFGARPRSPSPLPSTSASAAAAATQPRYSALPRGAAQQPRNASRARRAIMNVKLLDWNEAPLNPSPQAETSAAAAAIQPRYGGRADTAALDEEHWAWFGARPRSPSPLPSTSASAAAAAAPPTHATNAKNVRTAILAVIDEERAKGSSNIPFSHFCDRLLEVEPAAEEHFKKHSEYLLWLIQYEFRDKIDVVRDRLQVYLTPKAQSSAVHR